MARPLLVLKNYLLAKAFNALKTRTTLLRLSRESTELASYAAYLQIERKAFYALRLNAAQKFQNHTTAKIKKLFLQRRALRGLRQACLNKKRKREGEQQALLCRFIVLQKRALHGLKLYVAAKK
jgi:hypothetical protein